MTSRTASRLWSAVRSGESNRPAQKAERALPESAEDEGVWMELDPSGMVLDVRPIGSGEGALILQLHRRSLVAYQLSRVCPRLAASVARALTERASLTSTDVGRGLDGRYYALRSRLEFGQPGDPATLVILLTSAGHGEDGMVRFALEAQDECQALSRILGLVSQGTDFGEAIEELLPLLVDSLAMEAGAFFVVQDDNQPAELVAAYGPTNKRGYPYSALQLTESPLRALMADPRVVQLSGPDRLPESLRAVACRNAGRLVLSPAIVAQNVSGVLVVSRQRTAPLSTSELELLAGSCAALGLFARATSLMAASQHSAPILQTAYAVSRAISRSLDLERTYEEIAASAARVVPGSQCLLLELEQKTGDLISVAASQADVGLVGLRFGYGESGGGLGDLSVGGALTVNAAVWGGRVDPEFSGRMGLKSALLVPMIAQSELVGALLLYSGRERTYDQLEIDHARDVAEQAAIAIHNARLYRNLASSQQRVEALLTRLTRVREQEQQRFAQLVHDDVVQSIVGSVYRLDAFRRGVPEDLADEYDRAVDLLRSSIQDARRIISELRPPVLEGLGLVEALRSLVDRADADSSAKVGLAVNELPELTEGQTTALYKIAREAILNAVRHADASRVWVELSLDGSGRRDAVRLLVRDDGAGFAPATITEGEHYGSVMMEEQAMVVGGRLTIDSSPGSGTTVEAIIPLEGRGR
jgi:signal transduction histidine kinase